MILPATLKETAQKSQTSLLNIARDYVQALFLFGFYQQKESSSFLFKGGTALHLVFQSPRFSEDLDFSAAAFDCQTFEKLLENTLEFLNKNGLGVKLVESKPTTGGCLAIFSATIGEIVVKTQIEVSLRRPKEISGQAILVRSMLLPPFAIFILAEEKIVEEKIQALLTRKKPRDFFDLYFLLRSPIRVEISPTQRLLILKIIENLDRKFLAKELANFLPKSHGLIIKDLPSALKSELERIS